jgi:SAM-dependent methyltransferase
MVAPFVPAAAATGQATGVSAADVLRLNEPLPRLAAVATILGLAAAAAPIPTRLRAIAAAGGLAAAYLRLASDIVAHVVFDLSGVTRYSWLRDRLGLKPARWLNLTTGFDDTTGTLARLWPDSEFVAVDRYDPTGRHEAALTRARKLRPPAGVSLLPGRPLPLADGVADAVFLLMAAHEVRDAAPRAALFFEIARVLAPSGRLVVVEHTRGVANALAFGPGVLHFYPAELWREAGRNAGLRLAEELRLTPFVHGFVFSLPAPTDPSP